MSFNIKNILSEQVIKEPWKHKIVDNSISEDVFSELLNLPKIICLNKSCIRRDSSTAHNSGFNIQLNIKKLIRYYNIDPYYINLLYNCAKSLFDSKEEIWKQFSYPNDAMKKKYSTDMSINIQLPGQRHRIHDDRWDKCLTCITYLSPEHQQATYMHNSSTSEVIKDPGWKPNRSFIFCPENEVTWHSFRNPIEFNSLRFTINTTVKFNCMEEVEFGNHKKFRWYRGE
jgi:hypothetical protein